MITGPGSPSVLSNMVVSIEQHVDWVSDCLAHMRDAAPRRRSSRRRRPRRGGCSTSTTAPTSRSSRRANSWYMGANVPGKPRVFLPYVGGVDRYRKTCDEVVRRGYLGFTFDGPAGSALQRRRHPPRCSPTSRSCSSSIAGARTAAARDAVGRPMRARSRSPWRPMRPPGPEVGEIVDGVLPGAAGPLAYRLYRPASPGPHPIVVYFHGGGWVLGGLDSDDPFCRDLCVRSDAIVVSVDYRHAPEVALPRGGRRRVRRRPLDRRPRRSRWAACRGSSRSAAGARAATSPPSSASWPAMPADRASSGRCW